MMEWKKQQLQCNSCCDRLLLHLIPATTVYTYDQRCMSKCFWFPLRNSRKMPKDFRISLNTATETRFSVWLMFQQFYCRQIKWSLFFLSGTHADTAIYTCIRDSVMCYFAVQINSNRTTFATLNQFKDSFRRFPFADFVSYKWKSI